MRSQTYWRLRHLPKVSILAPTAISSQSDRTTPLTLSVWLHHTLAIVHRPRQLTLRATLLKAVTNAPRDTLGTISPLSQIPYMKTSLRVRPCGARAHYTNL